MSAIDIENAIVKIYTKQGVCFSGIVKRWSSENGVELINSEGEHFVVLSLNDIEAYSFIEKDNEIVKVKYKNDKPIHVSGNIKSLVELRKMKAKEEQDKVKKILTRDNSATNGVEYVSQFSFLQGIKKHSDE